MHALFIEGTSFIDQTPLRAMRRRGWQVDAPVRDPKAAHGRWPQAQGCHLVPG
jgi:hypothetical protein